MTNTAAPTKSFLISPRAKLSFPHLFEPQVNDKGEKQYNCALLFDSKAQADPKWKLLEAAVVAAKEKKFGKKPPSGLRLPFRDGGEKSYAGYGPGIIFINAKSKTQPGMVTASLVPITDPAVLYPGCWVRAHLSCYGYDQNGNRGVSFGLEALQKVGDDERLDGRVAADQVFDALDEDDAEKLDNLFGLGD